MIFCLGSPSLCASKIPPSIELKEDTSNALKLKVCGFPLPDVIWCIEGKPLLGSTATAVSGYEAFYSIPLPKATSDMCGKTITYHVTNVNVNGNILGETVIYIQCK